MREIHAEQEFLELIVKSIVENKDSVSIVRKVDDIGVLYTVSVAKDEIGKIIGKEGNTAKAIRTLLKIVALTHGVHATMKIDAPVLQKKEPSNFTTYASN